MTPEEYLRLLLQWQFEEQQRYYAPRNIWEPKNTNAPEKTLRHCVTCKLYHEDGTCEVKLLSP